jgi:hypothetical protein
MSNASRTSNTYRIYHPVARPHVDNPLFDPRDGAKAFFDKLFETSVSALTRNLMLSSLFYATEEDQDVLGFGYQVAVTATLGGRQLEEDTAMRVVTRYLGGEYVELGRNDLDRIPMRRPVGVKVGNAQREVTDYIEFSDEGKPRRLFAGDLLMRHGGWAVYVYVPESLQSRYPDRWAIINECPKEFLI